MEFLIVFGVILFIMHLVLNVVADKEVNPDLCPVLQEEQKYDIKLNKRSIIIMRWVSIVLLAVGIIGVIL